MTEHGHGTRVPFSPESAEYWDERYQERQQLWSGEPNGPLVVEVSALEPGRALDVGCGEGGDAIWLARRGWRVTAMDISQVALDRAAEAAKTAPALEITWVRASLTETAPEAGAYDLVSAQYFPIAKQTGEAALRGLLAAVAPGGTLLIVGHDLKGWEHHHELPFDPADYYEPHDIAELLDDTWTIQVDETRPRTRPAPEGTDHVNDTVLRAVRRPAGASGG